MGKKLEIFVIVVIIALIGIIYAFTRQPVLAPSNSISQNQNTPNSSLSLNPTSGEVPIPTQQVPTTTITYQGQDGQNALDLLKAGHQVEAKHYSFGDLVTGIDGIAPDTTHFWAMYVNGNFSQVGASAYVTKSTDIIKWQIDAVVNNQ